jgi:hypothetical protein
MPQRVLLGRIHKTNAKNDTNMQAEFLLDKNIDLAFSSKSKTVGINSSGNYERYSWNPVFIPAKEVLSLLKGFGEKKNNEVLDIMFDQTYFDLTEALLKTESKTEVSPRLQWLAEEIVNIIKGQFILDDTDILFKPGVYAKV